MLIRAIALSLALLIGIGAIIPLATETTEAGPRHHHKYRSHHRHYKKYSRAWWRQYHARQRHRKTLAARRRALRLQQIRLAKSGESSAPATSTKGVRSTPVKADESVALLPTGDAAPQGWKRTGTSPGELQFRVDNQSGSQIGSAAISVVGSSIGESSDRGRASFVGGVPTTSLRRDVINRMVRENGWVVNDYQKDVSGKKVYVVVAQSQASGGRVQSRMFYFTEVDGRIYSVATNASTDDAERLAEESEKVLNSLARVRPQQQAAVKE